MEHEIRILKLYSEHKEGYEIDSVITYYKRGYLMQYGECIQYQKSLQLNFWFIIIRLTWLTKIK